jgi:hypothetical protein
MLSLVLMAIAGYGATDGVPDVIRAKKFEVVDSRGEITGSIKAVNNGGSLTLYNTEGELVLSAQAHENGQFLLNNGDGSPSLHAGSGGLFIFNDRGNTSIQAGNGGLFIYDQRGKPCLAATGSESRGKLVLWNEAGKSRVVTPH